MKRPGHFQDHEIRCKCGCGFISVRPFFLSEVNAVRDYVGSPLRVNSWCRCPVHNVLAGGSETSSHLKGIAVDLATPTEYIKYRILLAAGREGFTGVGVGKDFIHLDYDVSKPPDRFWIY